MIRQYDDLANALLGALEDEILATADEDVMAGTGSSVVVGQMQGIVRERLRARAKLQGLPVRAASRRDRRGRVSEYRHDTTRRMVDRVLVANPVARALAGRDSVATMEKDELENLLVRLRMAGLRIEECE